MMMFILRRRKIMMLRENDVEENRSQDRNPFVAACAVEMRVNMSEEPLSTEI